MCWYLIACIYLGLKANGEASKIYNFFFHFIQQRLELMHSLSHTHIQRGDSKRFVTIVNKEEEDMRFLVSVF